jgi:protein-S-isoprenylcysteine O-methyltransferase Ste14
MQSDPFLDFHRTAESAGYPAMLIVSVFALALVVAPVMLLALTRAVWVLVIAVLSIFAALALLAGAFGAAVADSDEPRRKVRERRAPAGWRSE